ncbi:uncharacterized protein FSUBG_13224 [Fusarium subglutinans]|uniref:WSC domain-containing protein n=1 Tax=Gibberella subglutinans TaxID=42677 RepID=A0A8H5NYH3_GIBSU|nr:uncharacterized protein FSUBG_13224 [Fusarium subglutinans]KAF5583044.1 hypothetical protein FSUBG_13224 [Fusarium subglutinans]
MRLTSGVLLASASSAFGQFTRFTNSSTSAVESSTSSTSSIPTTATITGTTNLLSSSSSTESTNIIDSISSFETTRSIETASSIETSTTTSASSVASFELDLRSAVLGPGASFYPPPDGASILMSPVAAVSTLDRRQIPKPINWPFSVTTDYNTSYVDFKTKFVPAVASALGIGVPRIAVANIISVTGGRRKRAESVPCVFEIFADGEVVLAVPITGSSGNSIISTNPLPPKDEFDFVFRQSCNGENVELLLEGLAVKNGQGAVSTPIPSISLGTPTGTSATNSVEFTTNSEGETIFPTETTPATSSEAATTPSGGETASTTGAAATGTNSEGFTTNSQGETIFFTETATEVSSADGSTNSQGGTAGTATSTSPSATATLPGGFPGEVGDFTLFGCVASTAGFPTFTLAQSNPKMGLDICATLCSGRSYFGVYDTACYCGDEVGSATRRVPLDQCDIECPGDNTQFCGGESDSKLRIRQDISSNVLLTVYVALEAGVTLTESATQTVTDRRTVVTTFTTTVTNAGASSIATEVITATLVCSAGKCHSTNSATVYVFVEINGSECDGQLVYVSEPCSCAGGKRYIPKFCSAGSCDSITVYKPQQCPDWYNYNSFFVPTDTGCSTCPSGKVVYQPWEESWGTPDNCNDAVPSCGGYDCPSQHNVVRPHQGVNWNATTPHGASGGGSKSSSNNGDNGSSQSGSSSGSNNGNSSPGSNGESGGVSDTSPNGTPNGGSNAGSGSGTQGESQSSNVPGSKGSYPSTVPVVSSASTHVSRMISLLAALAALL